MLVGIIEGNAGVYVFNKIPASWLVDYGETPDERLKDESGQRIKSNPWKFVFSMLFIVINIKLVMEDPLFFICCSVSLWILTEISISDVLFGILPDQFLILLVITSVGFYPFIGSWKNMLFGLLTGFGMIMFIAVLGRIFYGKNTVGGGDIKLIGIIGLICGVSGVLLILALTSLISAGSAIFLIITKRKKRSDYIPMAPYISISVMLYYTFLWDKFDILSIW